MALFVRSITCSKGLVTAVTGGSVDAADFSALTTPSKLVGSPSSSTTVGEITVGTGLMIFGSTLSATGGGGSGTVTSITASSPLTGGTITTSGSIGLGTVDVAHGGTGDTTLTAFALLAGGTTSTGAVQSLAALGSSGNVLTSNGAGALPTFQAPATGGTVTSITASSPLTGGTITGSGSIGLGTVDVAHGGTGDTSLTSYAVLCGGTTSTGAVQPVASVGSSGNVLTSNGAGALPTFQAPATGGTVTSVSVTTANGVSGSVATATTTPAISLTLGAITPSSIVASGSVTGSNLSGTNTGDQTITLTGDITGSGTGSFATTLAAAGTAGTYGQCTTDSKGRVTSGATCDVAHGGTGNVATTAYGIQVGGTTTTSAHQAITPDSTGKVLTSTGTTSLPTWQTPSSTATPSGVAGGALSGSYPNPALAHDYGNAYGLQLVYKNTTTVSVTSGSIPDRYNLVRLTSGGGDIGVTSGGLGGVNAFETMALSGTVATTNASTAVVGTTTGFLSEFGPRVMTGTISSSTTTVTGTGTLFLTEITVNDLIGTSGKGFFRVTAVASNTSLTISATPGSAFASDTPSCIEQPTFQAGAQATKRVDKIVDNTHLNTTTNAAATASGLSPLSGCLYAGDGSTFSFYHVWITDTGICLSTQRTTLYGESHGGFVSAKRLGAVCFDTAGLICNFSNVGTDRRETHLHLNDSVRRVLNSGGATAYTAFSCRNFIPPTSTLVYAVMIIASPAGDYTMYMRPANMLATAPTTGTYFVACAANTIANNQGYFVCDGAQQFEYINNAARSASNLYVNGYVEFI